MPKGEVPVPYIIAIILGIMVLALLVYMFFAQSKDLTNVILEQTCKGKLQSYCSEWSKCNYSSPCQPNSIEFYNQNNTKDCESIKEKLSENKNVNDEICKKILGR